MYANDYVNVQMFALCQGGDPTRFDLTIIDLTIYANVYTLTINSTPDVQKFTRGIIHIFAHWADTMGIVRLTTGQQSNGNIDKGGSRWP